MDTFLSQAVTPVLGKPLVVREGDEEDVLISLSVDEIVLERMEGKPPCPPSKGRPYLRKHAENSDRLARTANEAARQRL